MSRWTDPAVTGAQGQGWASRSPRAVLRELKRTEAEDRNARTPEKRRRRNRERGSR